MLQGNYFSFLLSYNQINDEVLEMIMTVKSWGLYPV